VGVIGARIETSDPKGANAEALGAAAAAATTGTALVVDAATPPAFPRVYITVLAVLAPYRGRGIGSALLSAILKGFDARPLPLPVTLHVQDYDGVATTENTLVIFYKKFGFHFINKVENYYRRLECTHALVLLRPAAPAAKIEGALATI
jgi:ribosomal protein S18 acetylase RimI-like enzyme